LWLALRHGSVTFGGDCGEGIHCIPAIILGKEAEMELSSYDNILRKFSRNIEEPLEMTPLDAEDLAVHKAYMQPLINTMTKSYKDRAMIMERCFERLSDSFR